MAPAVPRAVIRRGRAMLRDLAYSPPPRALARTLEGHPGARGMLEKRGHGELLRRLASEALPVGRFYARLTLTNWKRHPGADFRLLQHGEVVYGNRIQAPPPGTPLEYRNIIVTSSDPVDFALDLPAKYQLHIGPGTFSTPEQDAYDRKYDVQRRDGLFSSVRGNTINPSRLLVTFPGFPPANSRVSFAVSYLKALTDADLSDTLMVCFQDCYGVSGTYMVHDNAGRPLAGRITGAITALMRRHGIAEEDVLLFGASKGASIAAMAARDLPGARQVLVVPQMSLPYYLAKPVLRGGLFRDRALWEVEQPGALLRRYLAEGRRIDYFYSDSDESSNASLIEYARDAKGLTKYRIGGGHAAVAKKSLPTALSLLRGFATGAADEAGAPPVATGLASIPHGDVVSHRLQFADDSVHERANVYLEGRLGRTRFRQLLSPGADPTALYTTTGQRTDPALHPEVFTHVVVADGTAQLRVGEAPGREVSAGEQNAPGEQDGSGEQGHAEALSRAGTQNRARPADGAVGTGGVDGVPARHPQDAPAPLTCDAAVPREYALLGASGAPSARVRYVAERIDPQGDVAQLRLVAELREQGTREQDTPEHDTPASLVRARFTMTALTGWRDLPVLARRLAIVAEVEELQLLVQDPAITTAQLEELEALDWPTVTVAPAAPMPGP